MLKGDIDNTTTLHIAASRGHKHVVEIILKEGFSDKSQIDRIGSQKMTSFFCACIFDHLEIAQILLDNGADINTR